MARVRPAARRALLFGAVLPALVAGCTVGPSDRPAVLARDGNPQPTTETPQDEAPLPPLGTQSDDLVPWADCDERTRRALDMPQRRDAGTVRYSCATVASTLDAPSLPDRGVLRISVLKAESGTGGNRIPLLVVNDIDGEPGTVFAARLAAQLPDELLKQFSIIGVDRRGTGESDPTDCIPARVRGELLSFDPAATNLDPLFDATREAGQECALILKNQQGALDTWRTAGDLDEVRRQLGTPFLHVLARGEGSGVVQAYAQRFTDKLGRVVLDGIPDPSEQAQTVLEGRAAGAEDTLDAFARDCDSRNCPLDDARDAVSRLLDTLQGDSSLPPGLAARAILTGLGEPDRWPALAKAIDAALDDDVRPLAEFLGPLGTDNPHPSVLDAALATACNDTRTRLAPPRIAELADDWRQQHPVFGGLLAQRLVWCSQWPVRREPVADPAMRGAPPVLVVSTAADPRTPELGTKRTAQQMPSSVRVGWEGAGHGAVGRSDCVTKEVAGFLVDGDVPSEGVTCPP